MDSETDIDAPDVADVPGDIDVVVPRPRKPCVAPAVEVPESDPGDCDYSRGDDGAETEAKFALDCREDDVSDECQRLEDACVSHGARQDVEHNAGNLPTIISMPHGGLVPPDDISDRAGATNSRDFNTM